MRLPVALEKETPSGHYVVPNALKIEHLTIPVFMLGVYKEPVAHASVLRREDDGRTLTMDIQLRPEFVFKVSLKQYEARADLGNLDAEKKADGKLVIRRGVIRSLALVKKP